MNQKYMLTNRLQCRLIIIIKGKIYDYIRMQQEMILKKFMIALVA